MIDVKSYIKRTRSNQTRTVLSIGSHRKKFRLHRLCHSQPVDPSYDHFNDGPYSPMQLLSASTHIHTWMVTRIAGWVLPTFRRKASFLLVNHRIYHSESRPRLLRFCSEKYFWWMRNAADRSTPVVWFYFSLHELASSLRNPVGFSPIVCHRSTTGRDSDVVSKFGGEDEFDVKFTDVNEGFPKNQHGMK